MIRHLALLFVVWATGSAAQTLNFPGNATLEIEVISPLDSYVMPIDIWDKGAMPTQRVEGALTQQAWRIDARSLTTLQLLRPLREQLRNARYDIIFECQTEACGGFDFRFNVKTLPPPEMQISLGDFRFLAARRSGDGQDEYLSLFVSNADRAGYVQVTHVGSPEERDIPLVASRAPVLRSEGTVDADLATQLTALGHVVLDDLAFETGSSQLGPGPFASLRSLADYLVTVPTQTVALVGHTDSAGSLDGNIALSKRRAASVLERLVSDYGINRRQLEAQGMGYLSPVASNLTPEGRDANRRVEVIITSTE